MSALDDPQAVQRLKHMLLCKIMTGKGDAEEVPAIVATKAGLKYAGASALFHPTLVLHAQTDLAPSECNLAASWAASTTA